MELGIIHLPYCVCVSAKTRFLQTVACFRSSAAKIYLQTINTFQMAMDNEKNLAIVELQVNRTIFQERC